MLTCETRIETDRPGRYLVQLCRHAAAMGKTRGGHWPRKHADGAEPARGEPHVHAEHTDTRGVITIAPWGQVTLEATADALVLRVDAADQPTLQRIQDVLTRDLDRFGRRDRLTVTWTPPRASGTESVGTGEGAAGGPAPARRRRRPGLPAVLVALLIAALIAGHLGLGGALLAHSRWTSLSIAGIVAIVAVKMLLVAISRRHIAHVAVSMWGRRRSHDLEGKPAVDSDRRPAEDRRR